MKRVLILFYFISSLGYSQLTVSPTPFEVNESITITIDSNSNETDCNGFNNPSKIYMHSGIGTDEEPWGYSVVGNWGQDDGVGEMTNNNDGTWSISINPEVYFGIDSSEAASSTKIGLVFRNENGSQEFKDNGCNDFFLNIGSFHVNMINPDNNSYLVVEYGGSTQILADNTGGAANYELYVNNQLTDSQTGVEYYNGYIFNNLISNQNCSLVVTQGDNIISVDFEIIVSNTNEETIPNSLEDGINYHDNDNSKATLVINAPFKDFVYVIGSFNNWEIHTDYSMKKDPSSDKYWIELDNLNPEVVYTYQYLVGDLNPLSNSPQIVKTADPFSTLVLSPYDDPFITENSYPNMPEYPEGQEREVTVLKTGQEQYNWQVEEFEKPKKEDLIIYEVLLRDFDSDRTYQNLINKIDYFKNLNINAIELLPVMEFGGNESWGYNTEFHLAADKFYGPEEKLKEFIDLCHQNGIAVILDLVLNHVYDRSPMVRMWMNDSDENGWGSPSSENPYFNEEATHSYAYGNDFNHQSSITQYYTNRVISHWIENFKIDGFRWDLTKGFTQNCSSSDYDCTNSYQQDRVDILKSYADYSWSLDPDHYVIFEHLGWDSEEQQWANHRIDEGKGIMLWGNVNSSYSQLIMGYSSGSGINRMGHESHGFTEKRLVGYFESHDEERLMYNSTQFGTSNGSYNITDLNTSLERMEAIGAISLTIPGPKMIWHFGELGMNNSIFTCEDGSVNNPDCKLSTKPQPQWAEGWLENQNRNSIYNSWSRINELKINEDVFEGDYSISSGSLNPIVYIWNNQLEDDQLKNIVILSNFDLTNKSVNPNFPYTGQWYDLMDTTGDTVFTINNTSESIELEPGQYMILGNQPVESLSTSDIIGEREIKIYPSPSDQYFHINQDVTDIEVYDLSGKLIKNYKGLTRQHTSVNISLLESGMYLVKFKTLNNSSYTKKIIIK